MPKTGRKISIITGNHLCHNPRVIKEAATLAGAGYEVEVLGAWFDRELKSRDEALLGRSYFAFVPVVDLPLTPAWKTAGRVKSKLGKTIHRFIGLENRWQISPTIGALEEAANKSDAELFIAHSEPAMVVACDLLAKGRKVGVDMEDWFSEDLLPEARRERPIGLLRELERQLLRRGVYRTCTSQAMAEALAAEYGCPPPTVVYNAFRWSDRESLDGEIKDRRDQQRPSIHWYSQTLGFGRGLDDLVAALPLIEHEAEIHLRGRETRGFRDWLMQRVPSRWRDRIFMHDLVSNYDLLSRIAEHDIGLATEQPYCGNKLLTVSNKILHYLLAGLAVIASDTAGQREVAQKAEGAISLYKAGDSRDLAAKLNTLLSCFFNLNGAKQTALKAARETFSWEKQEVALRQTVEAALPRET